MIIKQSSTARELVFLLLDDTDHVTGKTGLSPTVTISKNGGSFASPSGAVTEIANGLYKVAGNATDTNTLGSLVLHATGTGADPCDMMYEVVAVNVDDTVRMGFTALPNAAAEAAGGLYTRGTGAGQLNQPANGMVDSNVVRNAGTAITAAAGIQEVKVASIAADAITASSIATDAIGSAELAASAVTEIQAGLSTLDAAGIRTAVGLGSANLDTQLDALPTNAELATSFAAADDAVLAQLATLAGYIDTEVAAIKAKTDNLPSDPADASDIAASFTSIASTLTTLAAYVDTEVAAIKAKTDNLPSDPADQSAVEAAVTAATSPLATAANLATLAGYVDTEVAAIKAKTDNLPSDPADASDIAASYTAIASTLATMAAYIDTEVAAIKAKTDNLPSTPANEATLTTIVGYLDTEVAAIKAKTDNLPVDPADASDIAASFTSIASTLTTLATYIDTEVAAIKAKTDNLPATPAATGDAMTLTAGERTSIGTAVWASTTRTLSSFGTLVADIWAAATRTLTAAADSSGITTLLSRIGSALTITLGKVDVNDKTGFELIAAYDPAKTAATQTSVDDLPTNAELDTALSSISFPTADAVANAVWDEAIADHADAGSTGEALAAAGSAGDPWTTALPGAYADGTAGQILGDLNPDSVPGAFLETITVVDLGLPIAEALVAVSNGQHTWTALSNASGVASFHLDAGVYVVSITKPGYQFKSSSITVTG